MNFKIFKKLFNRMELQVIQFKMIFYVAFISSKKNLTFYRIYVFNIYLPSKKEKNKSLAPITPIMKII